MARAGRQFGIPTEITGELRISRVTFYVVTAPEPEAVAQVGRMSSSGGRAFASLTTSMVRHMICEWTLPSFFSGPPAGVVPQLQRYFLEDLPDGTGPLYTGAMFERLGSASDQSEVANVYTPLDIVAVSMLSVDVPPRAAIGILETHADKVNGLLSQIPGNLDLVDADDAVIGKGSAAWELWNHMIRSYKKVGPTKTSKLIARKRPRLIPIQDSVIVAALDHEGDFWATLRDYLNRDDRGLSSWLRDAHASAGLSDQVSELRVFDALVWMSGKQSWPRS